MTRAAVSEWSCACARQAPSLVLDREAEPRDIQGLAKHLDLCESCRRYAARVSEFTRHLRALRLDSPDDRSRVHSTKGARS